METPYAAPVNEQERKLVHVLLLKIRSVRFADINIVVKNGDALDVVTTQRERISDLVPTR